MALFAGVEYVLVPSDLKDPTLRAIGSESRRNLSSARLKLSKITLNDFRVHLEDRGIKKFPDKLLRENNQLRGLFLSRNRIQVVPSGITALKMLQKLVLSGNNISTLPAQIGSLVYLESLWVDHNQLDVLPVEVGKLVKLRELNLDANPLRKGLGNGPTFSEVWRGKENSESIAAGTCALQHERTPLHMLRRKTQTTLEYLKQNMPQDLKALVQKREKKLKQKSAKRLLREACKYADLAKLDKVYHDATDVGVSEDDLEQATMALKVLRAMDGAVRGKDLAGIKSALSEWSGYCKTFNLDKNYGFGPDVENASKARKAIEKDREREMWKKREMARSTPPKGGRLKKMSFIPQSLNLDSNSQTAASEFASYRIKKKISFNQWMNSKAEEDKAKYFQLQRMKSIEYKNAVRVKEKRLLQKIKESSLENKWPSRLVEAYPPGYFSMKGKRTVSAPVSKPRRLDDHLSARSRSRASPWNTTDDEAERTDDV